jgi:beta-xylosidase
MWIREPRFGWNLHEKPGFLRIEVDSRAGFENHGLLLRHAPEGDFEISTRVLFTPYANFQMAGLVIYQDDKNALYTHRGMCYIPGATHVCIGNGIYFNLYNRDEGVSEEGYQIGSSFPTKTIEKSEAYLRLTREGRTYTAYYSDDGETWVTIGRHESDLFPFYVGLLAIGAQTNPADADFDYFTLETLP